MNGKLARAVAVGVVLVGLALVPTAMLDFVRWGAIAAIAVYATWRLLRPQPVSVATNPEYSPLVAPLSAVLMVSVAAPSGRPHDERDWELFKGAIMQCVRGGDHVLSLSPGLYSVSLNNVDPDVAERIGQRISEQLQNLIVFDELGAIKEIRVGIGGVVSFVGSLEEGQRIAGENLKKLQHLNGVNVLMSLAA